jgi:hypothetical protein
MAELQIDPQLESTIQSKARGLHSIWNAIPNHIFHMVSSSRQSEYH